MQHETVTAFALQCVDDLLIGFGTQRRKTTKPLVSPRVNMQSRVRGNTLKSISIDARARVTTVDTRFAIQNF